jgi:hypothetical protein
VVAAVIVTVQEPEPVQPPPDQPAKVEPAPGAAVSVTLEPWAMVSVQSVPQEMPAGDEVTVPEPAPDFVTMRVYRLAVKVAVTVVADVTVTTQVPTPEQPPPDQPPKVEPPAAAAVSVTLAPWAIASLQSAPQLMPAGDEVTVPAPVPTLLTIKVYVLSVKVAVTVVAAVTVTAQVPVPVQPPPDQLVKLEPADGEAVRVTAVPWPTVSVQSAPQLMPAGDDVTVPAPVPTLVTINGYVLSVNVAVTDAAAVIDTTQVPVPEQPAPLQAVKVEPALGVAVRVTEVPWPKFAEQVAPQVMPAGDDVTVPAPVPALVTASVYSMRVKVAVTVVAAVTVTAQVPVPVQPPPDQPVNVEPATGVAVRVTTVP